MNKSVSNTPKKNELKNRQRSGYHHGRLREALVEQGIELLKTQDLEGLSLRRVARDLGVSQTAPTHHFPNKEAYLAAIAEQGFEKLFAIRIEALQGEITPRGRLMAVLMAHVRFAIANRELFRLMFGMAIPDKRMHSALWSAINRSYGVVEGTVATYVADRSLTKDQLETATFAVWTACHGLALLLLNPQESSSVARTDPYKIAKDVLGIVVAGLAV